MNLAMDQRIKELERKSPQDVMEKTSRTSLEASKSMNAVVEVCFFLYLCYVYLFIYYTVLDYYGCSDYF